jgi:competence protein ComEC
MKNYPVIKITLAFVIGIILQKYLLISSLVLLIIISVLSIVVLVSIKLKLHPDYNLLISILLYSIFLSLGAFISEVNKQEKILLSPNIYKYKNLTAYGTISSIELIREKEIIFNLDVDSLTLANGVLKKKIKLVCKLRDTSRKSLDSVYNIILPGNFITMTGYYNKGRDMRNPGEFDYNKYLNSLGLSGVLTAYHKTDLKILNNKNDVYKSFVFSIRKYLDASIKNLHNPETSKFLKGLLLADRGDMDYETKTGFINSGVIHVLSVSGLHVGYIILIFIILFGRLNIYLRSVITVAGIIFFMMITGNPAAMFRASVMGIVIIIAFLSNRSTNLFNSLALAALIILVVSPWELFTPGFQLSFSAVLAMGAIYPAFQRKINSFRIRWKFLHYLLLFMALSFSAQIGTLPFTLLYFGKLSLVAAFANLFVIPLTGVIVGLGIITLAINTFLPSIAAYYGTANDLFTLILFKIVSFTGNPSYSFFWVRHFSILDAFIFYFFLIMLIFFYRKFNNSFAKMLLTILIIFNTILFISFDNKDLLAENKLDILAIDVGDGDAILIKFPDGETALIDAGAVTNNFDNGERIIIPLMDHLSIDVIDYGFVSHLDNDHYGGFLSLVYNGRVRQIIKPPLDTLLTRDLRFESFLKEHHMQFSYYNHRKISIGNVNLYLLYNNNNEFYSKLSQNNRSGVVKLQYGKTSFLFPGDIERKAENLYTKTYTDFLNVDLLKAAHHGSSTSSSEEFLRYSSPAITVISAGIQNKFGHPSAITIQKLESVGSRIFRTDLNGGLLFQSDGDSICYVDWKKNY